MLFRSPRTVVQSRLAGEDTYVKPLRYAIFTITILIVLSFFYDYFFAPAPLERDWLVPARWAKLDEDSDNFISSFLPFVLLITIGPPAIVLMKLLFKKSWREAGIIILYVLGQLGILILPTFWITDESEWAKVVPFILFTLVFICFRKIFTGNVWLSFVKWVGMIFVVVVLFIQISGYIAQYLFVQVVGLPNQVGIIKPDESKSVAEDWSHPEEFWSTKTHNDPENTIMFVRSLDSGWHITCVTPQLDTLWSRPINGARTPRFSRVKLPGKRLGWLFTTTENNSNRPQAVILNEKAELLYTHFYESDVILNYGTIVGNTLLLAGGEKKEDVVLPFIDAIVFIVQEEKFVVEGERHYTLPNPRQRFKELFPLEPNADHKIEMIASKYEVSAAGVVLTKAAEISQLSLMHITLDTVLHAKWEKVVFQKTTYYSPDIEEFFTNLDTGVQRITASYTLPNDSLVVNHLVQLDLHGNLMWRKGIYETDYTRILDVATDSSGLYYCGVSVNRFARHPLVMDYRLSLLGHISPDGKTEQRLRYGKFGNNEWSTFLKVVPGDSGIFVFSYHGTGHLWGLDQTWQKLVFQKSDLVYKPN